MTIQKEDDFDDIMRIIVGIVIALVSWRCVRCMVQGGGQEKYKSLEDIDAKLARVKEECRKKDKELQEKDAELARVKEECRKKKDSELKRLEYADRPDPEEELTQYHVIVKFRSLSLFTHDKSLDVLQSACKALDINANADFRIVAVVGLFDKGKTFLINCMFGTSLPSGKLYSTQGMSFVYVPERKMLVVDTAGAQSTVTFRPQDGEPIADAMATEAFLFELIARLSDAIVFVVNDFTWMEQKTLAMFHNKDKRGGRARELIVVHNLRTTTSEEEAKQLFQQQIVSNYEGAESHLSNLVYKAHKTPIVHHVTICKAGSSAGELFNQKNLAYIMNLLEYGPGDASGKVLSKLLTKHIKELLPKFLLISAECQGGLQWELEYETKNDDAAESAVREDGYLYAGAIVSKNGALRMKTQGVISEFGEVLTFDQSFQPALNIFEEQTDSQVIRTIQIECPGVTGDGIKVEDVDEGLLVHIDKKKTINEASVEPVNPIFERYGIFEQIFPIPERGFRFCDDEINLENGLLKIILRKERGCRRRVTLSKDCKPIRETFSAVEEPCGTKNTMSGVQHKSVSEVAQESEVRSRHLITPLRAQEVQEVAQADSSADAAGQLQMPVAELDGLSAQPPPHFSMKQCLAPQELQSSSERNVVTQQRACKVQQELHPTGQCAETQQQNRLSELDEVLTPALAVDSTRDTVNSEPSCEVHPSVITRTDSTENIVPASEATSWSWTMEPKKGASPP